MKPKASWPVAVLSRAHMEYPKACGRAGLYAAAFFGHAKPKGVVATTESVWRGVCRQMLRAYCAPKAGD